MMKRNFILLALMFLMLMISCASNEITQIKGVKRVGIKQDHYAQPQFYVKKYSPETIRVNRKIASTHENEFSHLNIKKVYFLSLWQQQQTFAKMLGKETQKFCPQFHNDLLTYEADIKGMEYNYDYKQNFTPIKDDPKKVIYYPVMSLPYRGVDLYSYVSARNAWDNVQYHVAKAIEQYFDRNAKELQTLCYTGVSEGLYIYQNLVTYYSDDQKFINSQDALYSILKISPISNMLLLNSFVRTKFQGIWTPVQLAVIEKLNVDWFKNYLYEVSSVRNNTFSSYALKE